MKIKESEQLKMFGDRKRENSQPSIRNNRYGVNQQTDYREHKRQLGVPGRRLLRTGCYRCGNGGRYPGNWYLPGSFRPFGRPVECVLIGDDDCPECGGEMEVTDGEYRRTGGDGYLTPPEYSPIWEEKTCRNCGYKESNEPSY